MPYPPRVPARLIDWLAFAWILVVTWLSLAPLPELPEVEADDKLGHLAAYAVLAALATQPRRSYGAILATVAAIVAYGGLVEVIQPLVNRHGELGDFLANCAGVIAGTGIVLSLSWLGARWKAR